MKEGFKLENLLLWYSILILYIFVAFSPLMRFIFPDDNSKNWVTLSASVAICLYMLVKKQFCHKNILIYILLIVPMIVFTFFRSNWALYYSLLFGISLLLCILAVNEQYFLDYAEVFLYLLIIADILYAIITIVCFFNRSFYFEHVVPLFPWAVERLTEQYDSGCMAGLTSHYSTNAMFLSTGLLISAAMFAKKKEKKYILCILIIAIALLLTGKRAHILFSAMAIFVLYFFYQSKDGIYKMFLKTGKVFLAFCGVAVVTFFIFPPLANFIVRFQERLAAGDISFGRFRFWALAWESIKEHPVLGIGWKHYITDIKPGFDTHNVYLQLICETGIIGAFFFYAWFATLYFVTLRTFVSIVKSKEEEHVREKYLLGFSLAYQTFFFLYCLTGNPLYEIYMFIPYFISCAISIFCMQYLKNFVLTIR